MYKKIILGIAASIFSFGLAFAGASVQALDCIENCEEITVNGYAWAGENTDPDDIEIEEVEEIEETEEEPAMWPVYLSFGAIGVTFLLVLIINLSARKYNKK